MKISGTASAALALLASLTFAAAIPARAATTIFNDGAARDCADGAIGGGKTFFLIDLCTKALQMDDLSKSDRAKTYVNRAVIYLRLQAVDSSRTDLDSAQKRDPSVAEIYVNRGALYLHEHQYKEAIDEISHGLEMNPTEPEKAYYDRALARELSGDTSGAYYDYLKASQLNPKWPQATKALTRFQVQQVPRTSSP